MSARLGAGPPVREMIVGAPRDRDRPCAGERPGARPLAQLRRRHWLFRASLSIRKAAARAAIRRAKVGPRARDDASYSFKAREKKEIHDCRALFWLSVAVDVLVVIRARGGRARFRANIR